ncbi:MAG: hypothetical protein ACFBSC_20320 [Microcoleaceae cyanobacterium]
MESCRGIVSRCRFCQYYTPEGRRGGQCSQLRVPVEGQWESCSLAIPAFSTTWEYQLQQHLLHRLKSRNTVKLSSGSNSADLARRAVSDASTLGSSSLKVDNVAVSDSEISPVSSAVVRQATDANSVKLYANP